MKSTLQCILCVILTLSSVPGLASNTNHSEQLRKKRSSASNSQNDCMGELGCFPLGGEFFHPIYRPFQLAPSSREKINTIFELYTKRNPMEPEILKPNNVDSLYNSDFDPKKETKVIVHGFLEYWILKPKWLYDMRDQFLIKGDCNVILVKWKGGNNMPYTKASSNARVVGAELALLINFITRITKAEASSFHIIGHSLGAHVAGYAGARIKGLGRITGLDPAKLFFQQMSAVVRLDPTDAKFVDVVHSDITTILLLGLGMREPCGHIDYYPNGAETHPGCSYDRVTKFLESGLSEGFRNLVGCAHQRSVTFYSASINARECKMVSYSCPSYETFVKGRCAKCSEDGHNCPVIGSDTQMQDQLPSNNRSLMVYLKTRRDDPYCLVYYTIEVSLSQQKESITTTGKIQLTLVGSEKSSTIQLTKTEEELYQGSKHVYMVAGDQPVGDIGSIVFKWKSDRRWYNPLTWISRQKLFVESIEIKQMHVPGRRSVTRFCNSQPSVSINSGKPTVFNDLCKPVAF